MNSVFHWNRFLFAGILIGICLSLYSCHEASVFPNNNKPEPYFITKNPGYFPNKVGTKWVYLENPRLPSADSVTIEIISNIVLPNLDTAAVWKLTRRSDPDYDSLMYVTCLRDTVKFYTDLNDIYNPKKVFIAYVFPLKIANHWDYRIPDKDSITDLAIVERVEHIRVSGGIEYIGAFLIYCSLKNPKEYLGNVNIYFVPYIGMVNYVPNFGKEPANPMELVKYHIAK